MRNLTIIFIGLVLLFGCVSDWRVVAEPTNGSAPSNVSTVQGEPVKIGYLYISQDYGLYADGDSYEIMFTLEDKNGNVVASGGKGKLTIIDEENNTLYDATFTASESDFLEESGYPFYGNKVNTLRADFLDIDMSETDYADFNLEFTPDGGKSLSETKNRVLSYDLVNYSYDYSYDYYDDYLTDINKSLSKNQIEVRLVKGGMDSGYYNDYELEIEIKNLASVKKDVSIRDAVLVTKGKQYEESSYYEDSLGNIYPEAAVERTLYFYSLDELGDSATLYLELMVMDGSIGKVTEYKIDFKP